MSDYNGDYAENEVVVATYRGRDVSAVLGVYEDGQWNATVLAGPYAGDKFKLPEGMIIGSKLNVQVDDVDKRQVLVHPVVVGETTSVTPAFETKVHDPDEDLTPAHDADGQHPVFVEGGIPDEGAAPAVAADEEAAKEGLLDNNHETDPSEDHLTRAQRRAAKRAADSAGE